MRAYTTTTGDQKPGWDSFDHLVTQAAASSPGATVDTIAAALPAGISYHLIEEALHHAATDRDSGNVRYLTSTNHRTALATYRAAA